MRIVFYDNPKDLAYRIQFEVWIRLIETSTVLYYLQNFSELTFSRFVGGIKTDVELLDLVDYFDESTLNTLVVDGLLEIEPVTIQIDGLERIEVKIARLSYYSGIVYLSYIQDDGKEINREFDNYTCVMYDNTITLGENLE